MSIPDPEEALRERANARIGRVLREKWRVDRLLGLGGMAAVYAATHVNNGRRVAIKLLHPELSTNTEVRTRFQREGYVANKLEHPGAVGVLDDDTAEDGAAFLVMELLEGETLEDRRERSGVLPVHEVLSLADRLLDVLAAAHAKGIVHRDIKPENVFLTREGTVKVLDFGIARMRELQSARLTMTSSGAIGTPAFMPPEQARGRWDEVGPQSDIWAVGATMFTLLAGRLVHNADTVNELMLAAMTKPAPPLGQAMPGISPVVAHLVDRALAYDIKTRWPDARSMQTALRAAYQSLDRMSLPAIAPPQRMPQQSWAQIADPVSVSGYPMPPQPMTVPMMSPPAAPRPMMASVGAPMMATANPVTMVGATPARKAQSPMLAIIGAVAGMLVVGAVVFLVVLRKPTSAGGPDPSSSASATASASASAAPPPDPGATAGVAPSAAPAETASAAPAVDAPSASATASAAPTSKPATPPPPNKPGKFLRNPNVVKHR
ncbi:serine/threonine protein kinase [Minicystis rosea]|nr:serine/threonine protein kinase [Minicystis rosea]